MGGSKSQLKEFELYPKYKEMYIRAFGRMLEAHKGTKNYQFNWQSGQDVYDWWTGSDSKQITFFDGEEV